MDLYLQEKKAIVTGASRGIGRSIVKELSNEGVEVMAVARNLRELQSLQREMEAGNVAPVEIFVQDLFTREAPQHIISEAFARLGHVDILINNAGRSQPMDIVGDETKWQESMQLEFETPRRLTELLFPHFIERKQGTVLNIISSYELKSVNASAVAKSALVAWSKQVSWPLGEHGIRINCLQPGLIDTENTRRFFSDEQRKEFAGHEIPLLDFGLAEDMANMAVFLVSPRAKYITGSVAVVDGGMRRYPF